MLSNHFQDVHCQLTRRNGKYRFTLAQCFAIEWLSPVYFMSVLLQQAVKASRNFVS